MYTMCTCMSAWGMFFMLYSNFTLYHGVCFVYCRQILSSITLSVGQPAVLTKMIAVTQLHLLVFRKMVRKIGLFFCSCCLTSFFNIFLINDKLSQGVIQCFNLWFDAPWIIERFSCSNEWFNGWMHDLMAQWVFQCLFGLTFVMTWLWHNWCIKT